MSRYICTSKEHRSIIDARVWDILDDEAITRFEEGIDEDEGTIIQHYEEIHDLVTNFARLHYEQLQEATTILELVLWKAVIFRSRMTNKGLPVLSADQIFITVIRSLTGMVISMQQM